MPKELFLLVFSLIPFLSNAQSDPSGKPAQRPDSAFVRNLPKTGIISGHVIDISTNQPVEYASVAVYTIRDSVLIGGSLTDTKGRFQVTDLPAMGRFKLKISFIGYTPWESAPVMLTMDRGSTDIGTVKLNLSNKNLSEVTINAEKSDFQNTIDRKVYNLDKNIVNSGGSATEVLQNIPSVTVDMDGNVALRGSGGVTVYIDGKPSTLTGGSRQAILQQIPASAIEQIEVITNPSAKYDAEGMAGIINIKTKKGKLKGINGNASVSAGTNNKYNTSIGLNSRTSKINIYGNYSFRFDERKQSANSDQSYINSATFRNIKTTSGGEQQNMFHTAKAGLDLYLNNENTLGISGLFTNRSEDHPQNTTSYIQYLFLPDQLSIRNETSDEKNQTMEGTLDYRKTFKDSKREWTSSASYSTNKRDELSDYFSADLTALPYQKNTSNAVFTSATLQSDYTHPFAASKLETGVKGTMRINDNDVTARVLDEGFYINDSNYTDRFIYEEDILAGYVLYSGKFRSFDYSAGVRAEQTLTDGDSKTTLLNVSNDYFSLFPSATIKYNWNKSNDIGISYSRRTNRPNINSLNPFVDYSDTLNIRTGNPYLLPEFIHSAELSYSKLIDKVSATATLYYRHTDDVISRYRLIDPATGVSRYTMLNFTTADNIGLEGILRLQIKPGSIMWSFNIFQNTVNGKNIDPDIAGTNSNWNTRLTANLKASKNLSFQLTGMYSAPDRQPQRTIRGMMSGVDAGAKYDFWKGKGSLSLNVTDIFNTRKFDIHMEQDYFVLDSVRKRESRVGTLTFAYRFGTQDNPFTQRKKGQKNPVQEGGGENNDGGF